MTIEQAIELLNNLIGMVEDNQNNDYDSAFRMAIEALKQPELSERSVWFRIGETLVNESKGHISPEEAVEKIRKYLQQMKTPNKIIYCKDCEHRRKSIADGYHCNLSGLRKTDYDFCSSGKQIEKDK